MTLGGLLILAWMLISVFGAGYYFRFYIRRWWLANVTNHNLPPHQRWPEILQWQRGDHFEAHFPYEPFTLVSVESDGYAVVEWLGNLRYVHLAHLVGYNGSARTRWINKRLAQSNEYMELLDAFNKSVAELEERDKKLKLVS